MERMNEYQGNSNHANSSSVLGLNATSLRAPTPITSGVDGGPMMGVREQDQYMPIANVIRIMRRILPPHAKISDDAKETIQECVSEYISFVTGEANDRCQREQRKTVTAEDVLWAMAKLGFDDYVRPLTLFLNRHRAAAASSNNNGGSDADSGGPTKRAGFVGPTLAGGNVDPYGGYGPAGMVGSGQGGFVGMGGQYHHHPHPHHPYHHHNHHHHHHGVFDPMAVYYPGGSGGLDGPGSSSSAGQNGGGGYESFVQFK